jgi:hypothetical protein
MTDNPTILLSNQSRVWSGYSWGFWGVSGLVAPLVTYDGEETMVKPIREAYGGSASMPPTTSSEVAMGQLVSTPK